MALAEIANYYLGTGGSVLLALIVIVACLKTAIGLITAFSETFIQLFPKRSYQFFVALTSILPCLFANIGLTKIIEFSTPVLMFIYPLAITLILLALLSPLFNHRSEVYLVTTVMTVLAAICDGLNAAPEIIRNTSGVEHILKAANRFLPFFDIGMGWILPATIGFVLGLLWTFIKKTNQSVPN